jgi:hypothetical protein
LIGEGNGAKTDTKDEKLFVFFSLVFFLLFGFGCGLSFVSIDGTTRLGRHETSDQHQKGDPLQPRRERADMKTMREEDGRTTNEEDEYSKLFG